MIKERVGRVVKGLGGLFVTRTVDENGKIEYISCRAKGSLKRDDEKVLIGDRVVISEDPETAGGIVISEVLDRKNALIRPPLANLDTLFILMAARKPQPQPETVDKLIAIAEHNGIEPVVIITKSDLDKEAAAELEKIYKSAEITVFVTSSAASDGLDPVREYINENVCYGRIAAFAGASGVGKSTLMNSLFEGLSLATSDVSRKIERGRHTTRHVELFDIGEGDSAGHLADTPGFSLIDFSRFDFFKLESLADNFRELRRYRGMCRYSDCAHTREGVDECAVARAAEAGEISRSRLDSYRAIYKVLKEKREYD